MTEATHDWAAMRQLAEAVGEEHWTLYIAENSEPIAVVTYDPQPGKRREVVRHPLYPKDRQKSILRTNYIAAAHPAAVLALLARAERAEAERDAEKLERELALAAERSVRAERDAARAEAERMREALSGALASAVAMHSLLARGGKRAAPSNAMFLQMLADYEASIKRARAALTKEPGHD